MRDSLFLKINVLKSYLIGLRALFGINQ